MQYNLCFAQKSINLRAKHEKRMRTAIINQRRERDKLLSTSYLTRITSYDFESLLSNHNVKLITGPRRVGKSTQALLMLRDKNFAYLNFDDNNLLEKWNEELVMQLLDEVYPGYDYLLLDEVQNIQGWDVWVCKLFRGGINMVITGSNANMLSGEMATMLTGRYLEINMLPFSLDETMMWNRLNLHNLKEEEKRDAEIVKDGYLRYGGYPESVAQRGITNSYLGTLFDAIIYKDIVKRHNVRNVSDLNNVASYLLTNFCNPFSHNDLAENLGLSSVNTAKKFVGYLHEPFLFYYLPRYNNKLKLMKKAPQKAYVVDNGFVGAKAFSQSENLGRLLENQVFIELIRRGYDTEKSLFYYRSRNDKEVDFVLRNGTRIEQIIQVCYDMSGRNTEKREVSSLIECAGELKCSNLAIITYNDRSVIEKDGYIINVIPICEF